MEKATQAAARKRKLSSGESQPSTSSVQFRTRLLTTAAPGNSALSSPDGNSTCDTADTDHDLACCSTSNGSSELAIESSIFLDLEEDETSLGFSATSAAHSVNCTERLEETPLGELEATTQPLESNSTTEIMPSEAELEEFFAAAEKDLPKKIIRKYNYDVVKDHPLEGRYEWVQLQLNL